jgi:hypothetical protein
MKKRKREEIERVIERKREKLRKEIAMDRDKQRRKKRKNAERMFSQFSRHKRHICAMNGF